MFSDKIKRNKWLRILRIGVFTALIFIMSGCGNHIDEDVIESQKVGNRVTESENSSTVKDETSDNETTKPNGGEVVTTDEITDKTTTENVTTTEPDTTTTEPTTVPEPITTPKPTTTEPVTTPKPTTTAPKQDNYVIKVNTPQASGTAVREDNGYVIDYSNASMGYIMVKGSVSGYVQIYNSNTSRENLIDQCKYTGTGQYVTIPLTKGNIKYIVVVADKSGVILCTAEVNGSMADVNKAFTYPNYRVNFSKSSGAVNKAYEICAGLKTDREKVEAVKQYVMNTLSYNNNLAGQITSGSLTSYMPDADKAIASGKGICCDYACLVAVMLRCQNIPTKMVYGYVPEGYHAWNEVYYDGSWHLIDTTYEDDGGSKASSYQQNRVY